MIHECNCISSFQDHQYGYGKRLFNPMKAANQFRCSVCGNKITVGSATVVAKKNAAVESGKPKGKK